MSKLVHHKTVFAGFILSLLLLLGGILNAQSTSIGFSISDASIIEKDTFVIAVIADSLLSGRSVYAYKFHISYSPAYLELIQVEGVGSVLSLWGMPTINSSNAGTLILAGAGTAPLTDNGEMIYLKFRAVRSSSSYISFNLSESYLNERNPSSIYRNGYIYAAARSYPNIYPDQQNMFVGDEVLMSVSGGIAPYVYEVANPSVAVITDVNTIKAIGPGTTRVFVTDGNGEKSYTTGLFDVRAVKMEMEELSAWPGDTIYIPVKLEAFPGTTIFSGRFDLNFDSGLSGLSGDIIPGDYPVIIESKSISGKTTVSFASSVGITSSGVLCYLAFRANTSGNRSVYFNNMRFNESMLAWTTKSYYYINVNSLPVLNLSPNSGTMMWGEILKINVSNGTAPYNYSVSDTDIASIDAQGYLTAKSGGKVNIRVTDANGAVKTSGIFTIADNKVTIYSTDGVLDTETRVPIISSPLSPGKSIYSFSSIINFDDTYLDFVRVDPPNGGALIQSVLEGSSIRIVGASGLGIKSGVIGYLVFQMKNTLNLNASTNISFSSFSANENSLYSSLENGSIHRVEQVSYRPVAIAGANFAIQEGKTGHLDGSGSFDLDGGQLTYLWRVPAGFILSDTTSSSPEFTAPYVSSNTDFIISLVVNDGSDNSDPSEVKVTVLQLNIMPEADAGEDLSYIEGSSVLLDGSESFDSDGDVISYSWNSLDGVVLFNRTSPTPSFILPQVITNTSYRFTLAVNDGALSSPTDTVIITALQINKKPLAFAGGDFSVDEKEQAVLDGSLSYDADNDPISYLWTPPSGITLSSNTIAKPVFTAPSVHRDSVLSFALLVNDGYKNSDEDIVLVSIVNLDILSKEALIESVAMAELDSFSIDTTNAIISLHVPYGTDIRSLSPDFTLSKLASIYPGGGSIHDFSTPVYYSVTAEDGFVSKLWRVEIFRQEKTVQRQLNSGWNWISLNVQASDMSVSNLLGGLSLSDLDYLKSTEYSATYYTATGWFGNLSSFPQNRMVKFKKSIAENMEIQGREINPAISSIPYVPGWNSIAYLLKSGTGINSAIELSSIPTGDVIIKALSASSIYYEGSGWIGDLDSLKILHGYKLNVQSSGDLMYNPSGVSKKSYSLPETKYEQLLRDYQIFPENFEFSSTLIAEPVSNDGKNCFNSGDLILAYQGSECRGISEIRYIPALDKYVFILTYFSNTEYEEISFRIKISLVDIEYGTDLLLDFKADNITGEAYYPYKMTVDLFSSDLEDTNRDFVSIYPNPVIDYLSITATKQIENITLYSLTGKIIMSENPDNDRATISMQLIPPGIYTLKVETVNEVIIRKLIKTSY